MIYYPQGLRTALGQNPDQQRLRVYTAEAFARGAHQGAGQVRKYTGEPYINHPARCAEHARELGLDYDCEAGLWLHDVVEDTKVTFPELFTVFGYEIQQIVVGLTVFHERDADGQYLHNRKTRHRNSMEFLSTRCDKVKTCRMIDTYDNLRDVHHHDTKFAATYIVEKRDVLDICRASNHYLGRALEARIINIEQFLKDK